MNEYKNEIELIDYLNVIWKRKWLIIIPTFFLVIVVGVISFLIPPKWRIDAIIVPSKFLAQAEGGKFEEIVVVEPKQIAGQINQATYNNKIAIELGLDIIKFPKLKAENLKDTKLVRISLKEHDREKAKNILYSLFNYLKNELDGKANIEIKAIDTQIKSNEIETMRIREEIKTLKKKLIIIKERKNEVEKEMGNIKKRIEILEKEQLSNLKKKNKSEVESIATLLYSNEIQQSLRFLNSLTELLNNKKILEENTNLDIENKGQQIKQLENKIDNLGEKKGRIDFTQLIKEPTSSMHPVIPNKKFNVLIAGILGLFLFLLLAFFLEYIEKHKVKARD